MKKLTILITSLALLSCKRDTPPEIKADNACVIETTNLKGGFDTAYSELYDIELATLHLEGDCLYGYRTKIRCGVSNFQILLCDKLPK